MLNNLIDKSNDFVNKLVSSALSNSPNAPFYNNYVRYISYDTQKLEKLIKQYPASLLFNNPRLILETATNIVSELQKIEDLKQLHKITLCFNVECPDPARATTIKWWQYQLNKESRRDFEMLHYHFHKVSCYHDQYASKLQIKNYLLRMKSTEKWMKDTLVGINNLTLAQCSRSNYARFSEMYTILNGLNSYADSLGYDWTFITITAPPEFHSTPQNGYSKWDGSTPRDTNNYFTNGWHKTQSVLTKSSIHYFGMRTAEPHHDGSSHWHLMIWHKENDYDAIIDALKFQFPIQGQTNFKRNNGESSAASYVSKYIRKSIDLDGDNTTTSAVSAWRSCWGIRAFQFFGIDNQITKWRELRRIDNDKSLIGQAAKAGDFASYLSLLKSCNTALLKQIALNKYGEEYKRIVGISIEKISYITHSKCELLTLKSDINTVAVILNYSSNSENISPENKPILTRINSPPTK